MSKFKHGDRVIIRGLRGSDPIVVGDSPRDLTKVIVECHPTGGGPYTMVCHEDQLRLVPTRPEIGRPWVVYGSDGRLMAGFDALEKAKQYARVYRGAAIVDVRTGEWCDPEGERIP